MSKEKSSSYTEKFARFVDGINSAFAAIAKWMGLTSANSVLFACSFFVFCIAPLAIAVANLPELEIYQPMVLGFLGKTGSGYLFNALTPAIAVWGGFFVTVCINRGWSLNEYERSLIVSGQSNSNADLLPDLITRAFWAALFSAIFIPFILLFSNNVACSFSRDGCLFYPSPSTLSPWIMTGIDLELRTIDFLGIPDVYSVPEFSGIAAESPYALHIKMILRIIVKIVFVATLFDIWRIHKTITDAVDQIETPKGYDLVVKLGRRVLPRLLKVLKRSSKADRSTGDDAIDDPNKFSQASAKAIGQIGDTSAFPALLNISTDLSKNAWTRARAVRTIYPLFQRKVQSISKFPLLRSFRVRRMTTSLTSWAERCAAEEKRLRPKRVVLTRELTLLINQLDSTDSSSHA